MPEKKKLLVFLGAGAFLDIGLPSTRDLTNDVIKMLKETINDENKNLWPELDIRDIDKFIGTLRGLHDDLNFEHILNALESMDSLCRTWTWQGTKQASRVGGIVEGVVTGGPKGTIEDCFNSFWLSVAREGLLDCLRNSILEGEKKIEEHSDFQQISCFFDELRSRFDLYIVTTNYDLTIEKIFRWGAREQGFCSEPEPGDYYKFKACEAHPRLMHMHGSVSFGYVPSAKRIPFEDDYTTLCLYGSPEHASASIGTKGDSKSQSGHNIAVGPIISGLLKPDKLLAQPYLSYFNEFVNMAFKIPNVLIVGYGFGDHHVNAVFREAARLHKGELRTLTIDYLDKEKRIGDLGKANKGIKKSLALYQFHRTIIKTCLSDMISPFGDDDRYLKICTAGLVGTIKTRKGEILGYYQ